MNTHHSTVAAFAFLALSFAPGGLRAADSCTGDACSSLAAVSTGCAWTNKADKPVRLSVSSEAAGAVLAILAPGETFKEANKARCAADLAPRLDATFATLPKAAGDTTAAVKAKPVPKPKPAVVAAPVVPATPAASPSIPASVPPSVPPSVPGVAPVKLAAVGTMPLPRAKPPAPAPYPPMPRFKPQAPVVAAAAVAPAAVVAPSAPVAAAEPGAPTCGDACPPILFKVFDNCLWVLNLNPRPVEFKAEASGKTIALALEAADGEKADARAEAIAKGQAPKDVAAVHMRFRDPFQSAGSGIPLYRARLGSASACVKSRAEIAAFTARYTQ